MTYMVRKKIFPFSSISIRMNRTGCRNRERNTGLTTVVSGQGTKMKLPGLCAVENTGYLFVKYRQRITLRQYRSGFMRIRRCSGRDSSGWTEWERDLFVLIKLLQLQFLVRLGNADKPSRQQQHKKKNFYLQKSMEEL